MSITLFVTAQHFSLFTLHFSLPEGTTLHTSLLTFHFHNAVRCDSQCSALRWPMQRAAWAHAPHCGFRADVPHFSARQHLTEITAFLHTRCTLWQDSGRHAYERGFAPCISLRHTVPCPAPSLLGKAWRQYFCPKKQAVRTSLRISAPPGTVLWGQFCYENLVSLCMRRMAATSLRGHIMSISPCSATT